eukprot:INCI7068.4.p1 GENE.INCI7068.4~~INCI7068.4.p1  ORF type:complete len:287 (+),score=59.52 INCI7068.4:419-1279(+)
MACVIVAVDGSRLSFKAFEYGRRLVGDKGTMILLHAADEKSTVKDTGRLVAELKSKCEEFALSQDRVEIVILDQGEGSFGLGMKLDKRICSYVNSKMPACFVMGIFGKSGPSAFSKGSKTDHALRNCKVSVVVVKPDSTLPEIHEPATIVVGVRGTAEMDAKVVNGSLFLLSGKKDKLLLYHCRDSDVDVEAAEEMEASNKALCKSLKSNKIPFEYVQEDKTPGVPTVTHIMKFAESNSATVCVVGVDGMKKYREGQQMLGSVTDKIATKHRGTVCLVRDRPGTVN